MAARLDGRPALDAPVAIPRATLMVRRLESGRIASVGLQLDELMQVEPDERLLARLEEDADQLAACAAGSPASPAASAGAPEARPPRARAGRPLSGGVLPICSRGDAGGRGGTGRRERT